MASPDPLAPLRSRPDRAGVFSDFDGTLSAIVMDAHEAEPLPGVADALGALVGRYARVGVVSGRPAAFLVAHLGGRGIALSGLYGLEHVGPDDAIAVDDEVERWRPVVTAAADRAEADGWPPEGVERKGLSVTLHFRGRPERDAAARAWAEAESARTGLKVLAAKQSYELQPPVDADKGTALADLARGLDAVCFVGDDLGDLPAFDALDRMARDGAAVVRIGVASAEAPPELLRRSDLVVEGPAGALDLLRSL
ncbi:MAG: trehalose-6-phosphatase [Acidimicrobiales bacterium]|jgi:trehalose 6-phosphate phosphatase|nr:trehalose-6-phosphatase [Acidimicrobiales bacterium]